MESEKMLRINSTDSMILHSPEMRYSASIEVCWSILEFMYTNQNIILSSVISHKKEKTKYRIYYSHVG